MVDVALLERFLETILSELREVGLHSLVHHSVNTTPFCKWSKAITKVGKGNILTYSIITAICN